MNVSPSTAAQPRLVRPRAPRRTRSSTCRRRSSCRPRSSRAPRGASRRTRTPARRSSPRPGRCAPSASGRAAGRRRCRAGGVIAACVCVLTRPGMHDAAVGVPGGLARRTARESSAGGPDGDDACRPDTRSRRRRRREFSASIVTTRAPTTRRSAASPSRGGGAAAPSAAAATASADRERRRAHAAAPARDVGDLSLIALIRTRTARGKSSRELIPLAAPAGRRHDDRDVAGELPEDLPARAARRRRLVRARHDGDGAELPDALRERLPDRDALGADRQAVGRCSRRCSRPRSCRPRPRSPRRPRSRSASRRRCRDTGPPPRRARSSRAGSAGSGIRVIATAAAIFGTAAVRRRHEPVADALRRLEDLVVDRAASSGSPPPCS